MTRRKLKTIIGSKTYTGHRIITGERAIFQTIFFENTHRDDTHRYKPGEEATMESVATIILGELVREKHKA